MNKELSFKTVIAYSFGDVANNFAFAMGALFLLSYYVDVAGIGAAAAGTMLLVVRIFDAVADLTVGRIVDKVSTRWGKFRPFLLFASAPLMISSVLVFCVPLSWSPEAKLAYAWVTYMLLGVLYSLVNIPYGSLATAMTQHPRSRARLGSARSIGAALTFSFLAFVIGSQIQKTDDVASMYLVITVSLAIVGMVLYFTCFLMTKENVVRTVQNPSFKVSMQTVRKNAPLGFLCTAALCMLVASFTGSASGIFYARYVLGDASYFTWLVIIHTLLGTLVAAPFVPRLVGRFGKKNTFITGALVSAVGFILFFLTAEINFFVTLPFYVLSSIGLACCMTVVWALEADTVEYGEWKTGVRIEGLTYSLFSLTRKCGQAIGGSIPAFILGATGYIANEAVQSDDVIFGICASIALVPCIAMLLAAVIMFFYPLTDQRFQEIIRDIQAKRVNASAQSTDELSADDFAKQLAQGHAAAAAAATGQSVAQAKASADVPSASAPSEVGSTTINNTTINNTEQAASAPATPNPAEGPQEPTEPQEQGKS